MADQRLIDANALAQRFSVLQEGANMRDHEYLMGVLSVIDNAPTIDAVEVVHAHWVPASGKRHIWYCSACGDKINYKQNRRTYNIPKVPVEQKNMFCRNCGAKMDGGAEE